MRIDARACVAVAALLGVVGVAGVARAYSEPALFPAHPVEYGGGGGRWFTGSVADGYTCAVCHADAAPLDLEVLGVSEDMFNPGGFHVIELRWPRSEARVAAVLELVDGDGRGVGELSLPPVEAWLPDDLCAGGGYAAAIHEAADGRSLVAAPVCGAARLRVGWQAPATPPEELWLHVAAVAGDDSGDARGDRLAYVARPLRTSGAPGGCRISGTPTADLAAALLLVLLAAARRRGV